jgi:hypothetical protein
VPVGPTISSTYSRDAEGAITVSYASLDGLLFTITLSREDALRNMVCLAKVLGFDVGDDPL